MKKIVLALAAAGVFAPVVAQADDSTVTIYGRINESYEHQSTKNNVTGASTSGNIFRDNASRIGFQGSEDLGNGLKAIFKLELQFAADNGGAGTGLNNTRRSWVGLAGGFGKVIIGRNSDPFYDQYDDNLVQINHDTGATAQAYYPAAGIYTGRFNNGVRYDSPSFGGFTFGASYSHNGANDSVDGSTAFKESGLKRYDASVAYKNGPLYVAYGYERDQTAAAALDKNTNKLHQVVAAYDFGFMYLAGLVNIGKADVFNDDDVKNRYYQIGVSVPFAQAFDVSANYGHLRQKEDGTGLKDKATQYQVGVGYKFSKRTRTVAYYDRKRRDDDIPGTSLPFANTSDTRVTTYGIALRHAF